MATTPVSKPSTSPVVIAVAMQKGGVGKTTTAINLSYEFASAGFRVLLIDLDQQANATGGLGVALGDEDGTVYEVLTTNREERMTIKDVAQTTDFGVDVVPSTRELRHLEAQGLGPGGELRLKTAIQASADDYDIVVMDCPPALGHMTISAFTAADEIVAVVGADGPDEINGLVELANSVDDVREALNPELDIRNVLLANFHGGSTLAKEIRSMLKNDWPDEYLGEVSRTVRVGEAKGRSLPISVHSPDCYAATDYREVAKTLLTRIGK